MTSKAGLFVARDGSNNGTTPSGARLALGGLLAHDGVSPLSVRLGVLYDGGPAVVTGSGTMSYNVRAAVFVTSAATTNGPTVLANDATVAVATGAAPGTNSRIDVIWVRQHLMTGDGATDTDVIGEIGVTQGATAASPAVPAIPVGALALANATVSAGVTATNTLTFTAQHSWTVANGAPIPVRSATERGALTAFPNLMVNRLDTGRIELYNGTSWVAPGGDTGWVAPTLPGGSYFAAGYNAAVRQIGPMVFMRGSVSRATGFSTSFLNALVLPTGFAPLVPIIFSPSTPNLGGVLAEGIVTTGGLVQIAMSGANSNDISIQAHWSVD